MAIYIFTAIISSWIIWIDEKISDRNTNLKKWLLFFAILIPAIVAGMRASNIGTDVTNILISTVICTMDNFFLDLKKDMFL